MFVCRYESLMKFDFFFKRYIQTHATKYLSTMFSAQGLCLYLV